ncbi:MAG: DUF4340 domain-containing protein, partial [Chloroflexota bacterium]|nr:DUF4340 domain-containing protein [Chloroflexota bacterium]
MDKQPSRRDKQTRPVVTETRVAGTRRPPPSAVDGRMRSMFILGGAFVLLAGLAAYLLNTPAASVATTTPVPTVVVWDYSSATTTGMTVQNMTTTLTLAVQNGKWRITAPTPAEADDLTVSGVATSLKQPAATSKVGDNVSDLALYGLDSPALTVTLVLSGSTTPRQTLFVGKTNLDGSAYYVHAADSKAVYLVSNATIEPLKGWLITPPVALPTPTPLPTLPPTVEITGTLTVTGTTTGPILPLIPTVAPVMPASATPAAGAATPTAAGTAPAGSSPTALG